MKNDLDLALPPASHARVRWYIAIGLLFAGCDDATTAVDAAPPHDQSTDTSTDAPKPDAPVRAAAIVDCATATGISHTAEVTNDLGYVPTATVTLEVGQVARFGYADGGTEHTIVSGPPGAADGLFASPPFSDHGAFTCIRFEAPGTYPIHCDRHASGPEQGTFTIVF